jgi:hypothetical protein
VVRRVAISATLYGRGIGRKCYGNCSPPFIEPLFQLPETTFMTPPVAAKWDTKQGLVVFARRNALIMGMAHHFSHVDYICLMKPLSISINTKLFVYSNSLIRYM